MAALLRFGGASERLAPREMSCGCDGKGSRVAALLRMGRQASGLRHGGAGGGVKEDGGMDV